MPQLWKACTQNFWNEKSLKNVSIVFHRTEIVKTTWNSFRTLWNISEVQCISFEIPQNNKVSQTKPINILAFNIYLCIKLVEIYYTTKLSSGGPTLLSRILSNLYVILRS